MSNGKKWRHAHGTKARRRVQRDGRIHNPTVKNEGDKAFAGADIGYDRSMKSKAHLRRQALIEAAIDESGYRGMSRDEALAIREAKAEEVANETPAHYLAGLSYDPDFAADLEYIEGEDEPERREMPPIIKIEEARRRPSRSFVRVSRGRRRRRAG